MFAVVCETLRAGPRPVRFERLGRPEIKNVTLSVKMFDPVNRDLEIRDLYNSEDAFALTPDYVGAYRRGSMPISRSTTSSTGRSIGPCDKPATIH